MNIRTVRGKEYIFCAWRRRFVRLTPEEWVRQNVLQHIEQQWSYPHNLIAVEVPIQVGNIRKRCDAIVYAPTMEAKMLIEFKSEQVAITNQVLDQAVVYNRALNVPYLVLSNGVQTIVIHVYNNSFETLSTPPTWTQLLL